MPRKPFDTASFQEALGLRLHAQVFRDMKATLRDLADSVFDYDYPSSEQGEETWKRFDQQACELYPRLLKGPRSPECMGYLRRYIAQYVGTLAWKRRKQSQAMNTDETSATDTSNDTSDTAADPNYCPSGEISDARRKLRSSHRKAQAENSAPSGDPETEGAQPPASVDSISGTTAFGKLQSEARQVTRPVTQASASSAANLENARSDPIKKIKSFLSQCQPSMTYFLPSFIQLGFNNDEFLDGVLRWPAGELLRVLEKWKFAGKLTDLEVEALRMGFVMLGESSPRMSQTSA